MSSILLPFVQENNLTLLDYAVAYQEKLLCGCDLKVANILLGTHNILTVKTDILPERAQQRRDLQKKHEILHCISLSVLCAEIDL